MFVKRWECVLWRTSTSFQLSMTRRDVEAPLWLRWPGTSKLRACCDKITNRETEQDQLETPSETPRAKKWGMDTTFSSFAIGTVQWSGSAILGPAFAEMVFYYEYLSYGACWALDLSSNKTHRLPCSSRRVRNLGRISDQRFIQ